MSAEPQIGGAGGKVSLTPSASHAPPEVLRLAEKLGKAHGCPVKISREAKGYHIYLPCPECLKTHGKRELDDPKYAINASMYLGIGEFRDSFQGGDSVFDDDRRKDHGSSVCMRTRQDKVPHRFTIADLKSMGTVTEREPDIMTRYKMIQGSASDERTKHWEPDGMSGILCPPPAGVVIPLMELGDPFHPAIEYLVHRNYDIEKLQEQFRCGFCVSEYPHDTNGIYYRSMPGSWRDTPQHRIIFHSMIGGAPMTWQARVIEKLSRNRLEKYMLHPYKLPFQWDLVAVRANEASGWIPVKPFDSLTQEGVLRFKPSKYRTAMHSTREMMGWDAACRRADDDPDPYKWIVLCEGPLDAARVGPGGVALIGSSMSPENVAKVAARFHHVYTAFDTDKAGKGATDKIGAAFMNSRLRNSVTAFVRPLKITGGKDIGDMTQREFDEMFNRARKMAARQF